MPKKISEKYNDLPKDKQEKERKSSVSSKEDEAKKKRLESVKAEQAERKAETVTHLSSVDKSKSKDKWCDKLNSFIDNIELLYSTTGSYSFLQKYYDIGQDEVNQGVFLIKMASESDSFDAADVVSKLYDIFKTKHEFASNEGINVDSLNSDNLNELIDEAESYLDNNEEDDEEDDEEEDDNAWY